MATNNLLASAFAPKYRSFTLGILGLLALILLLLGLNILFSQGIDRDTQWSNLVGIERARLIQVESSLESMLAARQANRTMGEDLTKRLVNGYDEVDSIQIALRNGGDVNMRDQGENISVDPVKYPEVKEKLEAINTAWIQAKGAGLSNVGSKTKDASAQELSDALNGLRKQTATINTNLSEVGTILRTKASSKTSLLKFLQLGGMLLFTVYCGVCVVGFAKKSQAADLELVKQTEGLKSLSNELQSSKGETDMILGTVSEGLFLLDEEMNIGKQYSAACRKLFGIDDLAGQNFVKLFRKLVPVKTFDTAKKYMNLIFKPHIEEATLMKFNPFHELEINFEDGRGGFQTKYLDFRFNRIFDDKKVKLVMVTLSDVTDRVKLEQQLKESEEQTQRQLEMMLDILHCDMSQLDDFLVGCEDHLNQIGAQLKGDQGEVISSPERATEYRRMLDVIFRHMHTIKGDASMISLRFFESKAHAFEEKIQTLRNKTVVAGNDFLPITLALSELYENIREIRDLVAKLGDLRGSLAAPAASSLAPAAPAPAKPAEAPKPVEATKPAEAPKPVEAPKPIAAPKVETPPKVEVPKVGVPPKVEVPKVGVPPKVEVPAKVEAPKPAPAPEPVAAAASAKAPQEEPALAAVNGNKPVEESAKEVEVVKPEPVAAEKEPEKAEEAAPVKPAPAVPGPMVGLIDQLVTNLSKKQGKDLLLRAGEFDENVLPEQIRRPLRDIIVQLVRNSVTHGIERPDERTASQKGPQGSIQMSLQKETQRFDEDEDEEEMLVITVRDDGRGLLPEKLTRRALEMGRWSSDDINSWDVSRLNQLIFVTGFSTADEITTDAGRGVGMDIVRQTVEELGGTISVDSVPGQYCQFQLVLPN